MAAEAAPLIKVGGLGDISGSLPPALKSISHSIDIRLAIPFYPEIKNQAQKLKSVASFEVYHDLGSISADVYQTEVNEVITYLIDGRPISHTPSVYSSDKNVDGHKFSFFSMASLKLLKNLNWKPDILHAQDWHASPAIYKLHLVRNHDPFFQDTKTLLTVHNLPYLGYGTELELQAFGLPRAHLSTLPDWAEHLPLPLGLLSADKINTVSNGYAKEILTPEFGANLEDFLLSRKNDLYGILNGLDTNSWNPETDQDLPTNYSSATIANRRENKLHLLRELGLEENPDLPLLSMINRMDIQKGVDLVPPALVNILDLPWQAVILGTGDPHLEAAAADLDQKYPRIKSVLKYDPGLARRIYGGSDLILIPSRYEPCGLTQMIAMRYGCIPVARATGGLRDTIIDYQPPKSIRGTGFLFQDATSPALAAAIQRALKAYTDQRRWLGLQRRGMREDFSWQNSAKQYFDLYQSLIEL
jgi:starch synthase